MRKGRGEDGRAMGSSGARVAGFTGVGLILFAATFAGVRYGFSQAQTAPQPAASSQTAASSGATTKQTAKKAPTAKTEPVPILDIQARKSDILDHLNAIVGFYRSSVVPVQKAGEPNDVVYFDQSVELSSQAAMFAFQSAEAEAALLAAHQDTSSTPGEQQRLHTTKANVEQQLADLKTSADNLDKQMQTAKASDLPGLRAQRKNLAAAIALNTSMDTALEKVVGMSDVQATSGLAADIARLERSVPELNSKTKVVAPQLTTLEAARSSGVSSQGEVLFQLLEAKHSLTSLMAQNDEARKTALAVRVPISALLRSLVGQGQKLSADAMSAPPPALPPATPTPAPAAAPNAAPTATPAASAAATTTPSPAPVTLSSITTDFNALSQAAVPLSQELIVLEQSKANLTAWQSAVEQEYREILHALLLRIIVIAIALGLIFVAGEVWRRATNKYIRDARRRRQFLLVRRATVGFLSAIVVLFGFVTQFNSLATFAGFITAGIAVGLQTILLSVAAYFFIIGKYGVKVGDRITISSVTGDVIDVGLVRFYIMELAGNGLELNPTGRVAVFSNAVLFQAGTPLYKQIPGTEFAWHELIVKLTPTSDYAKVSAAVMKAVETVYETYRPAIEQQHSDVSSWMQAPIPTPVVESSLQFNAGVLQLWVRYPVEITKAAETDEQLTMAMLKLMDQDDEFKAAFAAPPTIQASVKG